MWFFYSFNKMHSFTHTKQKRKMEFVFYSKDSQDAEKNNYLFH